MSRGTSIAAACCSAFGGATDLPHIQKPARLGFVIISAGNDETNGLSSATEKALGGLSGFQRSSEARMSRSAVRRVKKLAGTRRITTPAKPTHYQRSTGK